MKVLKYLVALELAVSSCAYQPHSQEYWIKKPEEAANSLERQIESGQYFNRRLQEQDPGLLIIDNISGKPDTTRIPPKKADLSQEHAVIDFLREGGEYRMGRTKHGFYIQSNDGFLYVDETQYTRQLFNSLFSDSPPNEGFPISDPSQAADHLERQIWLGEYFAHRSLQPGEPDSGRINFSDEKALLSFLREGLPRYRMKKTTEGYKVEAAGQTLQLHDSPFFDSFFQREAAGNQSE